MWKILETMAIISKYKFLIYYEIKNKTHKGVIFYKVIKPGLKTLLSVYSPHA